MSIGTTIKNLRRERDITQEQLAEYLGISASAVSQWECDKSCPDISQLPILSNIFNVTTDEILSVDIKNNENRIAEISKGAWALDVSGNGKDSEALLRSGLYQFPNSYKIMEQLANTLYCNAFRCGADKNSLLDESLTLAEKVIAECTDIEIKSEAIRTAVDHYNVKGNSSEAEKYAMMLPDITRSQLLATVYKGSKLAELYKLKLIEEPINSALMFAKNLAELCDDSGRELYTDEEKLKIYQKIIDVYKIIYEDEDYDFFSQFLVFTNKLMARIYAGRGDADKVILHLEEAAKYAIMFETYDWEHEKTSLLFRGLKDGGWVRDAPDEKSDVITPLYESLSDEIYDFVRADMRFKDICDKLQKVIE